MADTSTADIEVDVPGTGVVSFPGDMSHEDIEATIRRGFKPIDTSQYTVNPVTAAPTTGSQPVPQGEEGYDLPGVMNKVQGGISKVASGLINLPVELFNADTASDVPLPATPGKPLIDVSKFPNVPFPDAVNRYVERNFAPEVGLARAAEKAESGLTEPGNALMLPFAAAKPIQALFLAQMGAAAPQVVQQTLATLKDPKATPAQKWEALGDSGIQLAMTTGLALHMSAAEVKSTMAPEDAARAQEQAKALPKTAAEVAKIQPQPKEPNAPQERQEPESVQGERAGNDKGGTPAQAGTGSSVQPAAEPPKGQVSLTPAIQVAGKLFTGEDHLKAYENAKENGQPDTSGAKEGFVNSQGQFVTREDAAKLTRLPTAVEPGKLHSSDLAEKTTAVEIKRYPNEKAAAGDVVPLKPGDEAPVRFVQLQSGANHIGWYEATKPFKSNDGGVYYPAESGKVKISSGQLRAAGFKIPEDQLQAFKAAGGAERPAWATAAPAGEPVPAEAGMGGAKLGEVAVQGKPDIHGVNNAVREEMAKAGRAQPPVSGEGISPPDSVQHGLDLLDGGTDPEQVMQNFEKTKRLNADDIAVVRARGAQLAYIQARIEEKFGTDSDEYRRAMKASDDWQTRYEPMRTDWHKQGQAQQGEVDIDTGTFTGLRRAFKDANPDKEFTPEQAKKAKSISSVVKQAIIKAEAAKHSLFDLLGKKFNPTEDAEKAALQAVHTHHQEWAARRAEAERKLQVAQEVQRQAVAKTFTDAEQAALKSANQTVRDAAVRKAKAERDAAVKEANRQLKFAKAEAAEAKAKEMAAAKKVRDAASKMAEAERRALADPMATVWKRVKDYIENGEDDFDDIRNKVATDLGMKVDQVTRLMAQDQRVKYLSDDMWRKQQQARVMKEQAKRWVTSQAIPAWERALRSIPRIMFGLKVGFHGTVALGTHAAMVAFQPRFWAAYARDFGKMYRMVASPAYYEHQVQDLYRRPNYIPARRAGLVNDPFTYEDYNSPDTAKYFGNLTGMGNRGYTVLKILRQDMFDQHWNNLTDVQKTPEMAKAIADGINHATGVVKAKFPKAASLALFAPRLEASRVMWMAGDPVKALRAFGDWNNASPEQKYFAINQVKEKAWVAGTMFSLLALNQGILSATGSKQQINLTDPMKSDFLKFKIAGMDFSYGNPMITMARLPIRVLSMREKGGTGKLAKLIYPDESISSEVFKYARSQMSPFASRIADIAFKGDYENRPLPKMPLSGAQLPMPKRLAARGEKPYTWTELGVDTVLPIPAEEAVRDVWKNGFGMSEAQIDGYLKAIAKASFMAATGARLTDDTQLPKTTP